MQFQFSLLSTWLLIHSLCWSNTLNASSLQDSSGLEIKITGDINNYLLSQLELIIKPRARVIIKASGGGDALVTRNIQDILDKNQAEWIVSGVCASACATIFMRTQRKSVIEGGLVLLHWQNISALASGYAKAEFPRMTRQARTFERLFYATPIPTFRSQWRKEKIHRDSPNLLKLDALATAASL
jgi:hypothetical protein